MSDNPILNNPYEEPKLHYATDQAGNLSYEKVCKGRRIFVPDVQAMPVRQGPQGSLFEVNDLCEQFRNQLINLVRKEVGLWREASWTLSPAARGKTAPASTLIVEITGMAKDKAMKKDYVNTRWLPAVNSVREKYGYDEWRFIEIAGDIRDIKNQLIAAIEGAVTA